MQQKLYNRKTFLSLKMLDLRTLIPISVFNFKELKKYYSSFPALIFLQNRKCWKEFLVNFVN